MALLEDFSLPRASVVTAESTFAMSYLRQRFPHLHLYRIEHAPRRLFHQVQRIPRLSPSRALFVGTLSYLKGGDLLFQAMNHLAMETNLQLVVVGEPDRGFVHALQKQVPERLWKGTLFKGRLEPEDLAIELAQSTMMLYPTRADNSPNAVKEAVVAGLPVVASRIGGIPDYVLPDVNGVLFDPEDLEGFRVAIRHACSHPLFAQGIVDRTALCKLRIALDPKLMGERFWEVYRGVLESKLLPRGLDPTRT
jgi:glycosyltransferase involved in cell wall biosynthesis